MSTAPSDETNFKEDSLKMWDGLSNSQVIYKKDWSVFGMTVPIFFSYVHGTNVNSAEMNPDIASLS